MRFNNGRRRISIFKNMELTILLVVLLSIACETSWALWKTPTVTWLPSRRSLSGKSSCPGSECTAVENWSTSGDWDHSQQQPPNVTHHKLLCNSKHAIRSHALRCRSGHHFHTLVNCWIPLGCVEIIQGIMANWDKLLPTFRPSLENDTKIQMRKLAQK